MITAEEHYDRLRRDRRRDARHAAFVAFCSGLMGGAVGVMLTVAIATALR